LVLLSQLLWLPGHGNLPLLTGPWRTRLGDFHCTQLTISNWSLVHWVYDNLVCIYIYICTNTHTSIYIYIYIYAYI
jgi:hypothetical protein